MEKKKNIYIIHNSILTANWVLIFRKSPLTKNTTQSHTHTRTHTGHMQGSPQKSTEVVVHIYESSVGKPKHGTFIRRHIPNLEGTPGKTPRVSAWKNLTIDYSWSAALPTEALRATSWDVGNETELLNPKGKVGIINVPFQWEHCM